MRSAIYKTLKSRLSSLIIGDEGEITQASDQTLEEIEKGEISPQYAVKHICLWNRQVEFAEQENIFETPAVFIQFGKIAWRAQSGRVQDAEVEISLHVVTTAKPEEYDDEFHLELLDSINTILHGYSCDSFSTMGRIASIPCHDHEELLENIEVFRCHVRDTGAVKESVTSVPELKLEQSLL
ncbi:MAG: hypothetical protein SNG79_01315 [Rikenellaceae bacterium]